MFSLDNYAPFSCEYRETTSYAKTVSWTEGTDYCSWHGVTFDSVTGHVISLDLSCSWLRGAIHPNSSVFCLHHLPRGLTLLTMTSLCLGSPELGRLSSSTHLNISGSYFSGQIPAEVSHLSKLVSLDLSINHLTVETLTLRKLNQNTTELKEILLDYVNMSTVAPSSLTMSSSLTYLSFRSCGLQGEFPVNILQLVDLQKLLLSDNYELSGHLPKSNWSSPLWSLDLSWTRFSGELPESMCNLKSVEVLPVSVCTFSGSFLVCLSNLTQITSLDFSSNNISGQIPFSLLNLKQLTHLDHPLNIFVGQIPDIFSNMAQLSYISLSGNQLTGPIPSHVSGPSYLKFVYLSGNLLNGAIPSWLFALPSLVYLDLTGSELTGQLGEFRSNSLEYIYLGGNNLNGPILSSIFKQENLSQVGLAFNKFNGTLDLELFSQLKILLVLDPSYNKITLSSYGSRNCSLPNLNALSLCTCNIIEFPNFLRAAGNLAELHLCENNIHGEVPEWAWDLRKDSLQVLNLSHNFLRRVNQIPWKEPEIIDIASNLLQGPLPIPPLKTTFFSVSNNTLIGGIL